VPGDVRADTVLRATARCFGASTTTLGSEVVAPEGIAVCDIAVPLRPHSSSAIDKIATARPATKRNEAFIAMSSQMRGREMPIPERYHASDTNLGHSEEPVIGRIPE
jgi:hypothetical protein